MLGPAELKQIKPVGASAIGAVPYTGLIRLRPNTDAIDMRYLALFVRSRGFADQISSSKTGVGIEHFGPTHLKRMWIRLPNKYRQLEAVHSIAHDEVKTAAAVSKAEREVALLREFRTRLVADVVTGQVDIRAVAASLPDIDPTAGVSGVEHALADLDELAEVLEKSGV